MNGPRGANHGDRETRGRSFDQVRFGVLGCASIARRRILPALRADAGTVVSAVAARDPARAARFAAEYDCAATDYAGLLARDDVDVVYIAIPLALRPRYVAAALRAGKHVLTEKPLAATPEEARELVSLATRSRRLLRENFLFPHHPQHAEVQKLVAEGRIGELRSFHSAFCVPAFPDGDIRYQPELGGGAVMEVGVYPLRAAQLLVPGELRVVAATLRVDERTKVEVSGQILLAADTGVLASLDFGLEHGYESGYLLRGSTARLRLDHAFIPPAARAPRVRVEVADQAEHVTFDPADQVGRAIGSFAQAVLAGRDAGWPDEGPRCAAAVRTVELAHEAKRVAVRVPRGSDHD